METIDVHASLLSLAEREQVVTPGLWFHDLSEGSLTYRFVGSENSFSWHADAIAAMPENAGDVPLTPTARRLVRRWKREIAHAESTRPDRVVVDHDADKMTLIWANPTRTQTIERI